VSAQQFEGALLVDGVTSAERSLEVVILGEPTQHDVDRTLPILDVGVTDVREDAPLGRLLTRIREAFDRGRPTEDAVTHGIKTTAGVVTSAAVVMISVFAIFATLSLLIFKQLGVGLAVAVLIDATIIRGVLLPATMKLLGDWNWYLPKWLEWLPHVGPRDGTDLPPAPEQPPALAEDAKREPISA
jgi:uncharacterized membrane protein YdfJ with MMPL/SSD domain